MATWFATAAGNINSAGRWNSLPNGSGTTLTWPPAIDDILVANNKGDIIVNVNTTVGELRNDTTGGATAGGLFRINTAGISLSAKFTHHLGGLLVLVNNASGTVYVIGNSTSGAGADSAIRLNGAGTLQITGNATCSGTGFAVRNSGIGIINMVGDAFNIGGGNTVPAVVNGSTGTINITGNVNGSNTATTASGAQNESTGTLTVSGYAQAGLTSSAASSLGQGVIQIGETRSASNGRGAVLGAFRYASATAAKSLPIIAGTQQTLSVLDVAALVPAVEDVRAGVVYGAGAYTGTLPLNRKRTTMAGRF